MVDKIVQIYYKSIIQNIKLNLMREKRNFTANEDFVDKPTTLQKYMAFI